MADSVSSWYFPRGTLKCLKKKNYDKISFRHLTKKSQQFDRIFPGQMTSPPPSWLPGDRNNWLLPLKHLKAQVMYTITSASISWIEFATQFKHDPCAHKNEGQMQVKNLCVNTTWRETAGKQTKPKEYQHYNSNPKMMRGLHDVSQRIFASHL